MTSSSARQVLLRVARAATLLLVSGGSLIFVPYAAQAQTRVVRPPITKSESALTAADLGMTEECFQQLQALMAEKEQRTPAQQKIDSQLIYLARMASQQPIARGIQKLEVLVKTDIGGRVLVDLKAEVNENLLNAIRYNGGEIIDVQPGYDSIRAWVVINNVEWLAERSDVQRISTADLPVTNAGSVTGQGDTAHGAGGASGARAIYNTDGSGVYVGALSDSNIKKAQSAATGDLPPLSGAEPTMQDLPGQTGSASNAEGTAMLEIVHDIAPGASLRFATAVTSQASFAANIIALQNAGCSVIVDDVFFPAEPPFMDGTVARAVDQVTANGALYFSSAGNQGNSNYYNTTGGPINLSSVWEGDYNSGGTIGTPFSTAYGTVHRYSNGAVYNTTVGQSAIGAVILYWSDAQGASGNDYDLYATDTSGSSITSASNILQSGTGDPIEAVAASQACRIYIFKKTAAASRELHLNGFTTGSSPFFTYTTDGQTHGHSQARNAFSVAAAPAQFPFDGNGFAGPFPGTFNSSSAYESFTSEGPRRVHYLNNGTAITPGNFSSTGGELRLKPDLTAADGANSSAAFAGTPFNPFYGTSAAAPHAAAIAALVRSYKSVNATAAANVPAGVTIDGSKLTTTEMRTVLINGCIDLNTKGATTGWDKVTGYGILMPKNALAFVTAFADPNRIAVSANASTATITWNTALPADAVVEYGVKPGVYTNSVSGTSGTSHTATITGLTGATGYYYRVRSKTGTAEANSGAIFVSPERSFATSGTATAGTANIIGTTATSTANPNPTVTLTLKNAGTGAASNLQITSATLGGVNTTTTLPTAGTTLAAGATTTSALTFSGVTSGTKVLVVKGSYNGAYFSFSLRVTVP